MLRLPTPWLGGSSWWLQFRDGTPVAQINADRRVLGWRAFGTACAGLPVGWTPGDALGEVEHLDHRAVAGRLDVADLFADVDGLTPTADGWMFEEVDRCPAWTVLEDAVIDAGATITFTSWYGDWPGGAGEVPVEAVMGIALDGRGVMLTTARDGLRADAIAADLVWEDESSPLPCRLDSTFTAQVVEP